jgi:hypothetical protein
MLFALCFLHQATLWPKGLANALCPNEQTNVRFWVVAAGRAGGKHCVTQQQRNYC